MAKVRIGINGFGRIGRGFVRCLAEAKHTRSISFSSTI
jgi:glyceraldehyde-3-phosphate dehydrogenase/erythrose-4-phosphate dehydrogenase